MNLYKYFRLAISVIVILICAVASTAILSSNEILPYLSDGKRKLFVGILVFYGIFRAFRLYSEIKSKKTEV